MKNKLLILSVIVFICFGVVLGLEKTNAENLFLAGTVIKGESYQALYYLGEDGNRYVFPNANIYYSWFDDFSEVVEIPDEELYEYPLGGNVLYKPGKVLVKIQTDPKVYAVSANGELKWVKNENVAKSLYGNNWNKMIDDVPDSFFTGYRIGQEINSDDDFDPVDEEESYPTISHGKGLKSKIKTQTRNSGEKKCLRLEKTFNNLQKRLARWGIKLLNTGDEVLKECYALTDEDIAGNGDNANGNKEKITLCHVPKGNSSNFQTIIVGASAVKAHLRNGDYLGACEGDTDDGDDDGDDDQDENAPIISNVSATTTVNSAVITWSTNEDANSFVEYWVSSTSKSNVESLIYTEEHSITINDLASSTIYTYIVRSADNSGNTSTSSEYSFTTKDKIDIMAPTVSSIVSTSTASTTNINWITDELATSKVTYSINPIASSTDLNIIEAMDLVLSHEILILNLASSTSYYYTVESIDSSDNKVVSDEKLFNTLSE